MQHFLLGLAKQIFAINQVENTGIKFFNLNHKLGESLVLKLNCKFLHVVQMSKELMLVLEVFETLENLFFVLFDPLLYNFNFFVCKLDQVLDSLAVFD
jgi:hypothetical protein